MSKSFVVVLWLLAWLAGAPAFAEVRGAVTIEATVVGVNRVEETGETVVDVSVPEAEAADLAARAATGRVALVLDARER